MKTLSTKSLYTYFLMKSLTTTSTLTISLKDLEYQCELNNPSRKKVLAELTEFYLITVEPIKKGFEITFIDCPTFHLPTPGFLDTDMPVSFKKTAAGIYARQEEFAALTTLDEVSELLDISTDQVNKFNLYLKAQPSAIADTFIKKYPRKPYVRTKSEKMEERTTTIEMEIIEMKKELAEIKALLEKRLPA